MGMMPNANPKMLLNKWLLSNAAPTSCPVKLKSSATVLNKLNAAVNSLKPNSTNPTNVPTFFTPKTLLLSIKSANSKLNSNKLKEKSKNLSLNAATPKRKLRRLSLMPSKLTERWNAESKKSLTNLKKTRRTSPEFKILSTNSKSKSRPTNAKPKNLKNKPTLIFLNTANFNTNSTKLKNVLIWLNLLSTTFALRPAIL